jgi:hypothetical protein
VKRWRVLLLHAADPRNATFSYHHTWPEAFRRHPRFDCTSVAIGNGRLADRLLTELRIRRWRGDIVVILHSVFSNACYLSGRRFAAVRGLRQPKAFFIGNEYKLMPEKMRFCEQLPVTLLISQSSSPEVHRIYRDRLGCQVIGIPNTGVDPQTFQPRLPRRDRPIDLGYRADDAPDYLGHRERRAIAEFFQERAAHYRLSVDISLNPADRFGVADWASFLNRCKGQLGSEAGGDRFELNDATRDAVIAYRRDRPDASFEELRRRFFADDRDSVPMRIISGRNVEAAATRTVQLLFDGRYDGYLQPDVHYIPLRKDFSNADEAVAKLRDDAHCDRLTAAAYDLAMTEFTYPALIDRFAAALDAL